MPVYKSFHEIPENSTKKHVKGSAPFLLEKLCEELTGAVEIKVSFFLYNNPFLHAELEQLSEKGCTVTIYSIPLNGYTKQPVQINKLHSNSIFTSSKYEYAEKIYKRVKEELYPNIQIKLFPQTYVWHKQFFSRGKEAYSLHNKSIMARMNDGTIKCISSSSNLAFADPPHSDNLLIVENSETTVRMFRTYFELLDKNSLSLGEYISFSKLHYDFEYQVEPSDLNPDEYRDCYYTAPFITYGGQGSNHFVQEKIIAFMNSAKQRIYVCSQHFMDIEPFDKAAKSIVFALGELAVQNPKLDVKVVKQTRADNQAQGKRTFLAEQFLNQIGNVEQRYLSPVVHDKFIIVDEKIIVMTANITPTQFAWGFPHTMKYQIEKQIFAIQNCFSEINGFHFIDESSLTENYANHFQLLWKRSNPIH